MTRNTVTADDADLALYDVDPGDPAAPELLDAIEHQSARLAAAHAACGPAAFFRHLSMQLTRLQTELAVAERDLLDALAFQAPGPADTIH